MKSKIIITCILVGFIITLFAIFNFKCPYSFKENVLYTQNDVSGYNENEKENNNLVNRNEAIKTARYYIEDILGNDLESANNKMYVNLYKNDSGAESYYWNISWSSPTLSCGIEINAINKQINKYILISSFMYEKIPPLPSGNFILLSPYASLLLGTNSSDKPLCTSLLNFSIINFHVLL